jgi:hypothetical protein
MLSLTLNMQLVAWLQLNTFQLGVLLFSWVLIYVSVFTSTQKEVYKYDIKYKLGSDIYPR